MRVIPRRTFSNDRSYFNCARKAPKKNAETSAFDIGAACYLALFGHVGPHVDTDTSCRVPSRHADAPFCKVSSFWKNELLKARRESKHRRWKAEGKLRKVGLKNGISKRKTRRKCNRIEAENVSKISTKIIRVTFKLALKSCAKFFGI